MRSSHPLVLVLALSVAGAATSGCGRLGYGATGDGDADANLDANHDANHDASHDASDGAAGDGGPPDDGSTSDTGSLADAGVDPDLLVWLPLDGDPAVGTVDVLGALSGARCEVGRCPTSAPGVIGQGYAFDGVDDYVLFDTSPLLDFGGRAQTFSVAVWYQTRRREPTSVQQVVFAQATGDSNVSFQLSFEESTAVGAYDVVWKVCESSCPSETFATLSDGVEVGVFRLAVSVWTGTESVLYIDAVEVARVPTAGIRFDGSAFMLGADLEGVGVIEDSFDGIIDDLRIYERALTVPEQMDLLAARGGP